MATKYLTELCDILLKDIYGETAAKIVGILVNRGRLTAKDLVKISGLSSTTVQRTLVALLQNRFVFYWTEKISLVSQVEATYYSANLPAIYGVLWTGSILDQMSRFYGDDKDKNQIAQEIAKNLHIYGNIRAKDLIASYKENRSDDEHGSLVTILTDLVKNKILVPLNGYDFNPETDIYHNILQKEKAQVMQNGGTLSEAAKKAQAITNANNQLSKISNEKFHSNTGLIKDTNNTDDINNKKIALITKGIKKDSLSLHGMTVDPEAVLSISHDKFLVISRNKALTEFARRRIGPITSKVYKVILDCYAQKINTCSQDVYPSKEFKISIHEINLDKSIDLGATFQQGNSEKRRSKRGSGRKTKRVKIEINDSDLIKEESDSESDDSDDSDNDDISPLALRSRHLLQHIDLLTSDTVPFLRRADEGANDQWYVPFGEVCESLRQSCYDDIVERKFGPMAARILRVVREKQKISESSLSSIALLNSSELRFYLSKLEIAGCLDLQEVVRGTDRAPSRTYYLWFHQSQRAYGLILEELYRTIFNLYTRLLSEKESFNVLLSKLEREDVKGNEDSYLTSQEKKELSEFRARETKILIQVIRLDSLIRIFRHY